MSFRFLKRLRGLARRSFGHELQKKQAGESSQELPANQAHIPASKYAVATGKEILQILGSAADVIPVPMLKQAIELTQKIIELCEEASSFGQKVKDLQDRVGRLMVVVLAHVTDKNEDGDKEIIVKAARLMEGDIQGLLKTLDTINDSLVQMRDQNRWLIVLYKDMHMQRLDDCMNQLALALEKFKLANDLSDSDLLRNLESRLQTLGSQVGYVARDVGHVIIALDRVEDKVDKFTQVMAKVKRSATLSSLDSAVPRQTMPLKPGVFCGRDSLVEEVAQLLVTEATSRVCILGPGGMGKTSVALAVAGSPLVQAGFQERCVWVPCIGASSAALLLETLFVQLQVSGAKQITVDKIISELGASTKPCLLVLDNFETPYNALGPAQKGVEDILRRLAQLDHVAILMTMRGLNPPFHGSIDWQSKNIQPMDEESCFRIYRTINPRSKDDPNVGRLLRALGYMPFAVTLMASLGMDGQSTAEELLQAWLEVGTDLISDENSPERSMNRSIRFSIDSDLVKQNPTAILLLSILSLLPEGTTRENLRWWAPTLKTSTLPSAVSTLSKAGLLLEDKQQDRRSSILFVVPVVQSFMRQHGRSHEDVRKQIHASCCQYVLAHAGRYDQPEFQTRSKALAAEDSNIQSILFGSSDITLGNSEISETTLGALIAFSWYRCDTKPSPDLAQPHREVTV